MSSSGWAWLPIDLLDSVLGKLLSITDYVQFSAVCKQWQSAASYQKERRMKSCHKQLPLLMQIPKYSRNHEPAALYSVAQGGQLRQLKFVPHYIKNRQMKFCGSTYGWLAYHQEFVLTLLNPFTGHTITLPPLPKNVQAASTVSIRINWIALSADLCLYPDDCEILVKYYNVWKNHHQGIHSGYSLAYFKAGDDTWSQIGDDSFARKVRDAVHHKGQFELLTNLDLPAAKFSSTYFSSIPTSSSLDLPSKYLISEHILESTGGDLLLVKRIESDFMMIRCIQVLKLLHADGNKPRWVAIKSIGSDVLFLGGPREAMCVSALDFPECIPNSIYFTDGVFNLDKTEEWIVKHKCVRASEEEMYSKTLLWVSPTIV